MLKQINISDLRLGMHLHALSGSWVDHPFWKTKFLLRDPADLAKLRDSGIAACWIDAAKGLDVDVVEAKAEAPVPTAPRSEPVREPVVATAGSRPPTVSIDAELAAAADLLNRSREIVGSLLNDARLGHALQAERCLPLVDDITRSVGRNPDAFIGLARLKTHDGYSYLHSVAVCALMVSLARQLGLGTDAAREAGVAGLLHDIGKSAIPLEVLNKRGRLNASEFELVKTHPARGHALLLGRDGVPDGALDVCLHHHERPDGTGYPEGLADAQLSRLAKMGAVCDVYDAITSDRPYKRAWDPADSLAQMAGWSKAGQFDGPIFRAFLGSLGVYPVGSLVRMRSGRLAVVVEQNAGGLLTPRVKTFYSTRAQMPVPVEVLDLSSSACTDRIVGRESNDMWKFRHLDELWAGREILAKTAEARA